MSDPNLDNETGCAWREPFALQVLGDSMEPEFPDKCIVIIEQAERCSHGMYIFVEVESVRWFRQYQVDAQGRERLIALNRLYPEIDLTGREWKVMGIIIQRNIRRRVKHYQYEIEPDVPEVSAPAVRLTELTGPVRRPR